MIRLSPVTLAGLGLLFAMTASPADAEWDRRRPAENGSRKTLAYPVDAHTWRVVARVEFHGDGIPAGAAGDALLRWWVRGVERHWNRGAVVEVTEGRSVRTVRLEFRVVWRRRAPGETADPSFHPVEVVRFVPEFLGRLAGREGRLMDGYRSWVRYDPRTRTMTGCWANLNWPTIIAHEFGHIWGLDDEYDTKTKGLARYFGGGRKEWPPSLMDWSWMPLARPKPRHFRAIWENIDRMGWKAAPPEPTGNRGLRFLL